MKRFIAYFDFLGYKNFILNNDTDYIRERINFILRGIEVSMGQNKWKANQGYMIADISNSKINCLNISDTVIFWTNDDSLDSFKELLKISFDFNKRETTCDGFPVRGAIVYDEIDIIQGYQKTEKGGRYNVNSIYGKGLVNAHLKAEDLNMASCIIDSSIVEKIKEFGEVEDIISDYAIKYAVPYKKCKSKETEYVLPFYTKSKINDEAIENIKNEIIVAFNSHNKGMDERAEILLKNTIDFLEINKG